jgi:hypothetical protein
MDYLNRSFIIKEWNTENAGSEQGKPREEKFQRKIFSPAG